jgi:beta-mannosidase
VGNGNPQSRVWTKGIWKAPYLVAPAPAALTAVKALVFYTGAYPRVPLTDTTASPFVVHVSVYWWAQQPFSGSLTVGGSWAGSENATVPVAHPGGGEGSATVALPAAGVSLWWPNGMIPGGADNLQRGALYTVTADLVAGSAAALSDARTVGFRVAHLVTANDTDPATLAGQNGSGNTTMRFKINGADAYVRGGNMIPMEELEGRRSAAAYEQLVASAAAANFNVMRVWGGGIYLDDAFFDATDRLGIMLYEDVMFSSDGRIPPVGNELEAAELRYQLRRLAGHPSIFLWSGCSASESRAPSHSRPRANERNVLFFCAHVGLQVFSRNDITLATPVHATTNTNSLLQTNAGGGERTRALLRPPSRRRTPPARCGPPAPRAAGRRA